MMIYFDQPYSSPLFSLSVSREKEWIYMKMQAYTEIVRTGYYPNTLQILKDACPGVLKTKCFNDRNLPFASEVQNTEIGHLFEHLVLVCLHETYSANGFDDAVFDGRTTWNWHSDKRGLFHIFIKPMHVTPSVLQNALDKAVLITERILKERQKING